MHSELQKDIEHNRNIEYEREMEREELKVKLGERLKEALKGKITQTEFASKCGLSYETLRTHIKGESFYRANVIVQAKRECGVSYEYLLCEDSITQEKKEETSTEFVCKETKLSADAVEKLRKKEYNEDIIECINMLILSPTILKKMSAYMNYVKCRYMEPDTEQEINKLEYTDIENILLYQVMKGIDSTAKRSKK